MRWATTRLRSVVSLRATTERPRRDGGNEWQEQRSIRLNIRLCVCATLIFICVNTMQPHGHGREMVGDSATSREMEITLNLPWTPFAGQRNGPSIVWESDYICELRRR